jgi:hypothetical protein
VFKKLLKAVTAFTLLVGCYLVYFHGFALIVEQLRANRRTVGLMFTPHPSNSKLEAIAHAQAAFGSKHWSAADDLAYRYYNAERGFWMYAKQVWRIVEENGVKFDGKRVRMAPFALITISHDGKNTKTVVSDEAVFDLNEPLGLGANPAGEPLKIKHAWIERNVMIRDDRSTPSDPTDDMKIGPLTAVEYDEPTQKIESASNAVIQDRDIKITGTELEIKLRSMDPVPGQSSGGFQGAEYAILKRNVHVVMRDVGKSGILPGASQGSKGRSQPNESQVRLAQPSGPDQKLSESPPPQPVPLDVTCDGQMRVDMPPAVPQVVVGPPELPVPTLVRFERNVVAIRGQIDDRPDQLTCDTLRLSLVPAEKRPQPPTAAASSGTTSTQALASGNGIEQPDRNRNKTAPEANVAAKSGAKNSGDGKDVLDGEKSANPASSEDGMFGNMTLQRVHATGHVVWLYLPVQGMKLKMNELIHVRQVSAESSQTYCRGDITRPFELDKVDMIQDLDDPNYGEVTRVTHIRAIDATLYDDGSGLDTANVLARGPGRLEIRPDRDQPVEHVAIWQKDLIIRNQVGSDGKVQVKIVDLTGNRPCFMDETQKASLDSAQMIRVWLKPKPEVAQKPTSTADGATNSTTGSGTKGSIADRRGKDSGPAEGGFQIDRLYAVNDVHLHAPSKNFTAHGQLDAVFDQTPSNSASASEDAKSKDNSNSQVAKPDGSQTASPDAADAHEAGAKPKTTDEEKPAPEPKPEPLMTGSANRIWLRMAVKPDTAQQQESRSQPGENEPQATTTATTRAPGTLGSSAEVRKVWMFGSVSLHQDPAEGKSKGNDASCEAAYIDNRGKGLALAYLYYRDPTENPPRPGPLPLAWVTTEDREIKGEVIRINQATDQAWVDGPGTSTQLTARGFLTDKAPEDDDGDAAESQDRQQSQENFASASGVPPSSGNHLDGIQRAGTHLKERSTTRPADSTASATKTKTRGGLPVTEKVPLVITWTKKMEFMGRSKDLEGQPAAKAIFYGKVVALMEDGLLQCEDHMITYADRIVPLTKLGGLSGRKRGDGAEPADEEGEPEPKPDLAVVECFGKAVAVSRKVHPDRPVELQREIVKGEYLNYDRRSGEFYVPGEGLVYLYDRPQKASQEDGPDSTGAGGSGVRTTTTTRRTVTPTSGRAPNPVSRSVSSSPARSSTTSGTGEKVDEEIPPLVLTKIKFVTGMRGRFGTGKQNDRTENRWAEFFGDVDAARAEVPTVESGLNFDKLPPDGFSLTGQMLRVITEPPPVGSPPSTPARNYLKVWDRAYAHDATSTIQADVITYDSYKDLIYAYGEQGREVLLAQQYAPQQPISKSSARVLQFNPKTHASYTVDNSTVSMVDKRTGTRPTAAKALDPNAKPPKKKKQRYRLPPSNIERRGFTGQ